MDYEKYEDVPWHTKIWFIPLGLCILLIVAIWEWLIKIKMS